MLRLPGAARSSSLLSSPLRLTTRPQAITQSLKPLTARQQSKESTRQQHAVSNPSLANIEKRWENLPPQEQAELWMQLKDRMAVDWHELTMAEKKASYWIAFGPHGPRKQDPPGETMKIVTHTIGYVLVGIAIFAVVRHFANPPPKTMNQEYQEKMNAYMKSQKMEPITGISSEGYTGKGMIQSRKLGKDPDEEEEDE